MLDSSYVPLYKNVCLKSLEPEEELLPGVEFLHFLVTPDIQDGHNKTLLATKLRPPLEIDGGMAAILNRQTYLEPDLETNKKVELILDGLPVLNPDVLLIMKAALVDIQHSLLTEWIGMS